MAISKPPSSHGGGRARIRTSAWQPSWEQHPVPRIPNFRWSIYYENESLGNPTVAQLQNDLQYIQSHYGANPSFLRVNGKFVVFVYADATDACGMADRWVQADNNLGHPAYIVLKVFAGYKTCASQPDSWHQYSPAVAYRSPEWIQLRHQPWFLEER